MTISLSIHFKTYPTAVSLFLYLDNSFNQARHTRKFPLFMTHTNIINFSLAKAIISQNYPGATDVSFPKVEEVRDEDRELK